ncbi:MAG: VWA domain-containing protein [Betaproteobacteria bacterium]|nr:VWA domain-containing protein [Betaproteobacteria bacterium]
MLIDFFLHLKRRRLPVSTKEFLLLLKALQAGVVRYSLDDFYFLARSVLVKDESLFDRYDRAFGEYFHGIMAASGGEWAIPEDWLQHAMQRYFSPEEKARIEKLGWDRLMEELVKRLEEQKERHAGGSKWIGTGGTSPFGHSGYHPEGIRIGGPPAGNRTAVKVWEKREFRNLDDNILLGTRNIQVALRRLRHFARTGAAEELDLDGTIAGTAKNAGWLDLKMRPERHNAIKVLLFLDVGGSMDDHVELCETLFSACRSEFKHLEYFYFHNCVYESVWQDNHRRFQERIPTSELLHKYGSDYKLIFVGDASMSPYEIALPGGSIEHMNEEPGAVWIERLTAAWPRAVWLNPEDEHYWPYRPSNAMIRQLLGERMFPLTLDGLERAMSSLQTR